MFPSLNTTLQPWVFSILTNNDLSPVMCVEHSLPRYLLNVLPALGTIWMSKHFSSFFLTNIFLKNSFCSRNSLLILKVEKLSNFLKYSQEVYWECLQAFQIIGLNRSEIPHSFSKNKVHNGKNYSQCSIPWSPASGCGQLRYPSIVARL